MQVKTITIEINGHERGVSAAAVTAAAIYFIGIPDASRVPEASDYIAWLSNGLFAQMLYNDFGWSTDDPTQAWRRGYFQEKQHYVLNGIKITLYGV